MDKGFEILFYSSEMESFFDGVEVTHNFDLLMFDCAWVIDESAYSSIHTSDVQI